MRIKNFTLVLIGAIPGAILRWELNNYFWANILGAACLGFIAGFKFGPSIQMLLGIGFCGSLTTFSGWIFEILELIRNDLFLKAITILFSTLLAAFFALTVSFLIGKKIRQYFRSIEA